MNDTDFLLPQKVPSSCTNSYYTLGVLYEGERKYGVTWKDFRKLYMKEGGDGIYGAWSVPYLEPVILEEKFIIRYPQIYDEIDYNLGLCPVAEDIQKKIMQFKTNYRSISLAKAKSEILIRTINKII